MTLSQYTIHVSYKVHSISLVIFQELRRVRFLQKTANVFKIDDVKALKVILKLLIV